MTQIKQLVAAALMGSISMAGQAAFPPDFKASYQLNKFGLDAAAATLSLQHQPDGSWKYHSDTEPKGLISIFRSDHITETSILREMDGVIKPISYEYIHRGSKKNRNMSFRFDWDKKIAQNIVKGQTSTTPLTNLTIDKFSLQLRMMNDLAKGKTDLSYDILDKGEIREYKFEIMGEEKLETPAGTFDTIKFKRDRDNGKRTTIMWGAKALHYLPVKIQHIEKDGTDFSLVLQSVSGVITRGFTPDKQR